MLDLGFKLTKTKILAIEKCAQIVYDEIPKTDKNADFTGKGFRAVTPLLKRANNLPVMAHYEAGYFISKMCLNPTRCYDEYLERLLLIKHAEEVCGMNRFVTVEDFTICELIRIYLLLKGRINVSDDVWKRVRESLISAPYAPFHEPMSENHKLCFMSSEFIAAQTFPDDVFYDGLSGKNRIIPLRTYLIKFLHKRLRRGWCEYESISYYDINYMSLLNLYDFSDDEEIKRLASDCLNTMTAAIYHHSISQNPAGPKGRVYPNAIENPENSIINPVKIGAEREECELNGELQTSAMFFATSPFLFDEEVYSLVCDEVKGGYEVKDSVSLYTIPDDMYIKGRTYKYYYRGENWCMGCVSERDNPYEDMAYSWLVGHQEQMWSATFKENRRAVLHSSHPGHKDLPHYGAHSVWTGDAGCWCQQFAQDKNTLLCYWNITDDKQLRYIHFYLPEKEFDKVEYNENEIILTIGATKVKICVSCKFTKTQKGDYKDRELIFNSPQGAFSVEISDNGVFSGSKVILNDKGAEYKNLKIENNKSYIDNNEINKSEYKLYSSPYLESEYDSGEIFLTINGKKRRYGT